MTCVMTLMNGWRMLELHRRAHSIAECLRGLFDGGTVAGTEFKAGKYAASAMAYVFAP